jgi:hypothetical protein
MLSVVAVVAVVAVAVAVAVEVVVVSAAVVVVVVNRILVMQHRCGLGRQILGRRSLAYEGLKGRHTPR